MERKELFRALVGSWNYGLNVNGSDKDYKVFLLPTFKDLYKGDVFSHDTISEVEDLSYQDIRKLGKLLFKANVNWLEILFSKEVVFNQLLTIEEAELINEIFDIKDDLATMNLSYLYDACIGMHIEKVKKLYHYSESCEYMKELYGYNVKEALHAYRILHLLKRFADNGFKDFEKILVYETGTSDYEYMMKIRNGEISEEMMIRTLSGMKIYLEEEYKELYHSQSVREDIKLKLDEIIYELVKLYIAKEN